MAAASKWRLTRSPRELRSFRTGYTRNIAIGTSFADTRLVPLFFFFFFVPFIFQKSEGWWRLKQRMLREHVSRARGIPSFRTLEYHLLLHSRPFSPRVLSEWTRYLTPIQPRHASKRRTALFFYLNHPLDFNALSVGKTLSIRVSSRDLLWNMFTLDSWTFRGRLPVARWHASGEYENLHFQKSQRANSLESFFDASCRFQKKNVFE